MSTPYIMVAPSGARKTTADHPAIPITIAQSVAVAQNCHAVGADAIHLHVRKADGSHSIDVGQYREAIAELGRAVPTMDVQVSTESGGISRTETLAHVGARSVSNCSCSGTP